MITYIQHPRFERDLKKLIKKYRSLADDLEIAKIAVIELNHLSPPRIDNQSVELVPKFDSEFVKIFKIKKFACKSMFGKGVRSGIRVVYAFSPRTLRVTFLEIYYKTKDDMDMNYDFVKKYFVEQCKAEK